MEEKVIFEYRAERNEDGYHYVMRRADQRLEIKSTLPLERFAEGHPARWAKRLHRMGHHAGRSRRAVRKTLDTFERMYRDIYGDEASSVEAPGTDV
jgi:hypothetical protein